MNRSVCSQGTGGRGGRESKRVRMGQQRAANACVYRPTVLQ